MIPLQTDMTAVTALRLLVGLVGVGVLLMWTVRRARGVSADPTLRWFKATETGSASFLVSGIYAVGGVVAVIALILWPWLQHSLGIVVILALVVAAHVWWEAKEDD